MPKLAFAVDRQDRVLDRPEASERADQDGGLDPGGELPGNTVTRRDAEIHQPRGDTQRLLAVLREGDLALAFIEQKGPVGSLVGAGLDQGPEVALVDQGHLSDDINACPRSSNTTPSWPTTR